MKLISTISIELAGEDILARPGRFARLQQALGGSPNLHTGRRRAAIEASALVDAVRGALDELGATDAISLIVDDHVLFLDRERRRDDLGELILAFHEHAGAMHEHFHLLRLAIEHTEGSLHLVLEVQARREHAVGEPAVRVVLSGRLAALEPRPGEDAGSYRARVEPLVADRAALQVARSSFERFGARASDAIARAMPAARVELEACRTEHAASARDAVRSPPRRPQDPHYDPHDAYYPNPLATVLGMVMAGTRPAPPESHPGAPPSPGVAASAPAAEPPRKRAVSSRLGPG
jgi:hypothetical protein